MNEMPPEWSKTLLGDVVKKITSGGTPKVDNPLFYGGDIPFLKIDDITASFKYLRSHKTTITELGLQESSAKVVPAGTLLITMYGTIGKCCITTYPVTTNQAIACFLDHPKIDLNYFYYCLSEKANDFSVASSQTTQANISATILKQTSIALPPLPEQKKIAEILSGIDDCLRSLDKKRKKLTNLKFALINSLLLFNEVSQQNLQDVCSSDVCYGILQYDDSPDKSIPVVQINNFDNFESNNFKKVSKLLDQKYSRSRVKGGDLLISVKGSVGKAMVLPDNFNGNISRDVARISLYKEKVLPQFIRLWMISTHGSCALNQLVVGTTRKEISIGKLRRLNIPIPKIELQKNYCNKIEELERNIDFLEKKIKSINRLKISISSDLLSGHKRVSV